MAQFTLPEFFPGDKFLRIQKNTKNPRAVVKNLGNILAKISRESFKKQALFKSRWPARFVPNVPGIISDVNRGATPPKRRFDSRPALIDKRALQPSITSKVISNNAGVVGTTVGYGKIHNEGGTAQIAITANGRERLGKWLKKKGDKISEKHRGIIGALAFGRGKFSWKVRKRPFLANPAKMTPKEKVKIGDEIARSIQIGKKTKAIGARPGST